MLITGARVATSATAAVKRELWLREGLVYFSTRSANCETTIDLSGFLILPGLINAHDHLEFNLFPRLGQGPYPNATVWAKDIFDPSQSSIREQLAIPKAVRLVWGGIKNLISGVTTVAHHNSFHPIFESPSFPVRVLKHYGWAHSLYFSPDWLMRFRQTPSRHPFIMHAGEGTDSTAQQEIQTLADAGAYTPSTVLVHAVALDNKHIDLVARRGTSVVWCPTSNQFTLGRTISQDVLRSDISIALGTDSGMTGAGDLFDEFQEAQSAVDPDRIYRMVTADAARTLNLPAGFGDIRDGGPADFLIMADSGKSPAQTLVSGLPMVVVLGGTLRLIAVECARAFRWSASQTLRPLEIDGRGNYLIAHDLHSLLEATKSVVKHDLKLAGKPVAE